MPGYILFYLNIVVKKSHNFFIIHCVTKVLRVPENISAYLSCRVVKIEVIYSWHCGAQVQDRCRASLVEWTGETDSQMGLSLVAGALKRKCFSFFQVKKRCTRSILHRSRKSTDNSPQNQYTLNYPPTSTGVSLNYTMQFLSPYKLLKCISTKHP